MQGTRQTWPRFATIRVIPLFTATSMTATSCVESSPNISPRPSCISPLKATWTARSLGPEEFVRTNIHGTFSLLGEAMAYWQALPDSDARALSLPARFHRRGVRFAGRERSGVLGDHALRAQQSLCRLEGGVRSPGARVVSHLQAADADDELLEQLRTVPVSGEADPADDSQRAQRQGAAGVRRWAERARLAVRG